MAATRRNHRIPCGGAHSPSLHPAFKGILVCIFLVLVLAIPAAQALDREYRIEIIKSQRELRVLDGRRQIRAFAVSFGKYGGTKRRLGDNKTPTGHYRIVDFNTDSKFYFFMQIDYPNLLDAWHGYKDRLISPAEFRQIAAAVKENKLPPQHTALGGYIGIHGLGEVTPDKLEIHESFNWTEGCIALRNEEINELRKYVTIGTRIDIRE